MSEIVRTTYQENLTGFHFFRKLIWGSVKANPVLLIILAIFIAYVHWQISVTPNARHATAETILKTFVLTLPLFAIGILLERFVHLIFRVRPESPLRAYATELKTFSLSPERLANGLPQLLIMFLFTYSFCQIKTIIPLVKPFEWDPAFMALDRWLHFGIDPWVLLHPLLGYWPVTLFFDWMYYLWMPVIYAVWVVAAFSKQHSILRTQFLISFLLIWAFAGSLAAIYFSSAGPVYYGALGLEPDPYAPLLSYLHQVNDIVPLMAVKTQELLWLSHIGKPSPIDGISAMPSMHNCAAILVAIYGWKLNRALGVGLSIFAMFIFLGSIHLGWHYAVDGYLAALFALACWWLGGILAAFNHKLTVSEDYSQYLNSQCLNANSGSQS